MSDILNAVVSTLNEKLEANGISGTVKIDIAGEGAVVIDGDSASVSDAEADCTLSTDSETLQGIFSGDVDPTSAFMGGKLTVDGDMGMAMQLSSVLA